MAAADDEVTKYKCPEEAEEGLRNLSVCEYARIQHIAAAYSRSLPGSSPGDLLQESFLRILEGKRRWPRGLGAISFLKNTISSIVSSKRKSQNRQAAHTHIQSEADIPPKHEDGERSIAVENSADFVNNPEYELMASELAKEIEEVFADNSIEYLIVEGMMEGLTHSEIRDVLELSKTEYESRVRSVRRKLQRTLEKRD